MAVSHQPFINSWHTYHRALVALGVFAPASIRWPPPEGHTDIDVAALKAIGLSDEVVHVVKHLPYLIGEELHSLDFDIAPDTRPTKYIQEKNFHFAHCGIKDTHVLLTSPGKSGIATALIYDTETGRLIPWRPMTDHKLCERVETTCPHPSNDSLYSHIPSYPATDLLNEWSHNLISLTWLPLDGIFILEPSSAELEQSKRVEHLKHAYDQILLNRLLKDVYELCGWDTEAEDLETARKGFDMEKFVVEKVKWEERIEPELELTFRMPAGDRWRDRDG